MEEIKNKIIIVFLGVIFMLGLLNDLFAADKESEIITRPRMEYKASDLKDPFQSPKEEKQQVAQVKAQEKPLPQLVIQGIVWGGSFPQAIINNKVVKIGDTIEEVRIIDIKNDGVTVSFENRTYDLSSPAAVSASTVPIKKL